MSTGSNPDVRAVVRNDATIIGYPHQRSVAPWPFERLFIEHFELLDRLRHEPEENGYLVVAVRGNTRVTGSLFVPADDSNNPGVAIIGRHACAGLLLDEDPSVALRHLMLRVNLDAEGLPVARLLDLHTGQGVQVDKAGRCESVASDGALLARLGDYALFILPAGFDLEPWSADAAEAWREVDAVSLRDARAARLVSEVLAMPRWRTPRLPGEAPRRRDSQITLLPALASLQAQRVNEPMPPETAAVVTLLTGSIETIYPVTRGQLDRGALLGRYGRCALRAGGLFEQPSVSRVHAVLLTDGDDVLLIDTASTNGTYLGDESIAVALLPDEACIDLGGEMRAIWQRMRR